MNVKKAKRLRAEIKYHPSEPRKYAAIGKNDRQVIIHPHDRRSLYQEMKRENQP